MKAILFFTTLASIIFFSFFSSGQSVTDKTRASVKADGSLHIASSKEFNVDNVFVLDLKKGDNWISDNGESLIIENETAGDLLKYHVLGGGGDDILIIDIPNDGIERIIFYDGQNNNLGTAGDVLELRGDAVQHLIHTAYNKNDGSLKLDNCRIEYSGLEPITSTITATSVTLNYSAIDEIITIAPSATSLSVNSTAGEAVTFTLPSSSFFCNAGSGNDLVEVDDLSSLWPFIFSINLNGQAGANTLVVDVFKQEFIDTGNEIQIDNYYTINYQNFGTVTILNALTPVPTASEWGLIGFILLLASTGIALALRYSKIRQTVAK